MADLREKLAANAHDAWARWTEHLLSQCVHHDNGAATIPASAVQRWKRQIMTPFVQLSDLERTSDLKEADIILELIEDPQ